KTMLRASKSSVGTLDWRAAHEHLKHADATRARWREHRELKVEYAGQVSHEHRLARAMSDRELLELASPGIREALEGEIVSTSSAPFLLDRVAERDSEQG